MLLKELKLENFMGYEEGEFAFSPGVNLIVGPNASGKSTIFDAIELALFGKGRRFPHRKMYVRSGANGWKIVLGFEHAGNLYRIESCYDGRRSRQIIWKNGQEIADRGIRRVLEQELGGATIRVLEGVGFIRQGQFGKLVSATSSERSEWVKTVTGMKGFEVVEEAIALLHREAKRTFLALGGANRLAELEAKVKQAEKKARHLNVEKRAVETRLEESRKKLRELKEKVDSLRKKREAWHRKGEKEKEAATLAKEIEELRPRLEGFKELEEAARRYEDVSKRVREAREKLSALRETIGELETRTKDLSGREKELQGEIRALKAELLGMGFSERMLKRPDRLSEAVRKREKELIGERATLNARLKELREKIEKVCSLEVCPYCGQVVSDEHKARIEKETKAAIGRLERAIEQNRNRLKKAEAAVEKVDRLKELCRELKRTIAERNEQENRLKELKKEADRLSGVVRDFEDKEKVFKEAHERYLGLREVAAIYRSKVKRLEVIKRELGELKPVTWTEEEEKLLKDLEEELNGVQKEVESWTVRLAEIKKDQQYLKEEFETLREEVERIKAGRKRYELINSVREGVKSVKEKYQELLLTGISEVVEDVMARFGFDCSVSVVSTGNGGIDFRVKLPELREHMPVSVLSGAQSVAFEFAVRLAVAGLTGLKGMDLIMLDEPTHNLDAERIQALISLLNGMKAEGVVKQVLVTSHEKEFRSCADVVHEVALAVASA